MDDFEIKKRLYDFANYLDKMPSCLNKGELSNFLVGYSECYKKLRLYEKINEDKEVYLWKI